MTFQETLRKVLRSADAAPEAVFGHDDVQEWPEGALTAFVDAGLLREAEPARAVVCDGCAEACLADVEFLDLPGSPPRAYVVCDKFEEMERIEVPLEKLDRWAVDLTRFAEWAARELGASGGVEESGDGRLWWLGRVDISRQKVDLFLARGAAWPDASTAFRSGRLQECPTALVLVPCDVPSDSPFGAGIRTLSLLSLLVPGGNRLHVDRVDIEELVGGRRRRRTQTVIPIAVPPGTTWGQVILEFVNDETVRIAAGSFVDHRRFEEVGFRDWRKTGEHPDELWSHLRTLAKLKGEIGWSDGADIPQRNRHKVKKWVQDIRARLKACFPTIPGDPFEDYRRVRAYKTKFILRSSIQAGR